MYHFSCPNIRVAGIHALAHSSMYRVSAPHMCSPDPLCREPSFTRANIQISDQFSSVSLQYTDVIGQGPEWLTGLG